MVLRPISEAQQLLGTSRPTTYRLAHAGAIPAIKVGSTWRVDIDRLKALIEKRLEATAQK